MSARIIKSAATGEMFVLDKAADEREVATRMWRMGLRPTKPQKPLDVGLFSDDADQKDLPL